MGSRVWFGIALPLFVALDASDGPGPGCEQAWELLGTCCDLCLCTCAAALCAATQHIKCQHCVGKMHSMVSWEPIIVTWDILVSLKACESGTVHRSMMDIIRLILYLQSSVLDRFSDADCILVKGGDFSKAIQSPA